MGKGSRRSRSRGRPYKGQQRWREHSRERRDKKDKKSKKESRPFRHERHTCSICGQYYYHRKEALAVGLSGPHCTTQGCANSAQAQGITNIWFPEASSTARGSQSMETDMQEAARAEAQRQHAQAVVDTAARRSREQARQEELRRKQEFDNMVGEERRKLEKETWRQEREAALACSLEAVAPSSPPARTLAPWMNTAAPEGYQEASPPWKPATLKPAPPPGPPPATLQQPRPKNKPAGGGGTPVSQQVHKLRRDVRTARQEARTAQADRKTLITEIRRSAAAEAEANARAHTYQRQLEDAQAVAAAEAATRKMPFAAKESERRARVQETERRSRIATSSSHGARRRRRHERSDDTSTPPSKHSKEGRSPRR